MPASAQPRPPPPAAAAARPAAGAGNVQRSSAFFILHQPGRLPTHFCTSTPGASLPFFSASRGSGSSSVRSPRPLPLACLGDRSPAAPSEAHCGEPRPCPGYLCFYCPGSVSLCNPQGFGLGVRGGGDASSPFSFAVGGGRGDAGAGLWLRPRQLGTAPVSALLLARRAEGCAAVEPERQSPSQRPRVPHSPRPFPAARARARTRTARRRNTNRGGGKTASRAGLRNFARHSLIRA